MKNKKNNTSLQVRTVYLPGKYGTDKLLQEVLRYLVLFTAVVGMNIVSYSMLGLSNRILFLTSVYTFTTFYLMFRSFKGLIAGTLFGAAGMWMFLHGTELSLKEFFFGGFNGIVNAVLSVLHSLGYDTIPYLPSVNSTLEGTCILLSVLPSLVVALSCRKKTRCLPYAVLVLIPTFAYVFSGGDAQLRFYAPAVAAAVGMAVMGISDKGSKVTGRSAFSGFTSFALACLLLISPIVSTDTAMGQIGILSDFWSGINFSFSGGDLVSGTRSAALKRRMTTGRKIMTIYTETPSPIYFRTWAGGTYKDEKWYPLYYDLDSYATRFILDFDTQELLNSFYMMTRSIGYTRESMGFGNDKIKIRLEKKVSSLPIPSMGARIYLDEDSNREIDYGTQDGVGVLSKPFGGEYTTRTAVFDGDDALFSDLLDGYLQYMNNYVRVGWFPEYASSIAKAYAACGRYGTAAETLENINRLRMFINGSAYNETVTDEAIIKAVDDIFECYDIERYYEAEFVPYGMRDGNGTIVRERMAYTLGENGIAHVRDIAAMVADYLNKNCEYSTNPNRTGKSVTNELLYGSKEGYCVQFATVGTLIMRRLGFPARYAEGYIAQRFTDVGGEYGYMSRLTDEEGHAWVEIWVDGFGWMTYEMTPGYGEAKVNNVQRPPVSETTKPPSPETTPETTPETSESITETQTTPESSSGSSSVTVTGSVTSGGGTESGGGGEGGLKAVLPIVITVAVIIPSVGLLSAVMSSTSKKKKKAEALISRALSGDYNSEERKRLAASLERALALALGAYGILPKDGELPETYGERLERSPSLEGLEAPLARCVEALCRHIYGLGMEDDDLKASAFVLRALRSNAPKKLGLIKFAFFRLKGVL